MSSPQLRRYPSSPPEPIPRGPGAGNSEVPAIFYSAALLFLYRQANGTLSDVPSMVFVAGGRPNYATIGDATMDHRGDLVTNDALSHSISAWRQVNFPPPIADASGPYTVMQGDPLRLDGSAVTGAAG